MTFRKVMNMGLDEIMKSSYNEQRKMLKALNEEANRRILVWKKNNRPNIQPPKEMQEMIDNGKLFRQTGRMTKQEVFKQIQQRAELLSMKTSTVWGAREHRKGILNRFKNYLQEHGVDVDKQVTINSYMKFEKLKKRLKDNGILAQLSQDEYAEAVKYMSKITTSKNFNDIDDLYKDTEEYVNKQLLEQQLKKSAISNELMRRIFEP